jgi:hypothetical protein
MCIHVYPRQNNLVRISLFCLISSVLLFTYLPSVLQKEIFHLCFSTNTCYVSLTLRAPCFPEYSHSIIKSDVHMTPSSVCEVAFRKINLRLGCGWEGAWRKRNYYNSVHYLSVSLIQIYNTCYPWIATLDSRYRNSQHLSVYHTRLTTPTRKRAAAVIDL